MNQACSEAALEYVAQVLQEQPGSLRTSDDVRQCLAAFDEGASMSVDELLVRLRLKKPN